MLPRLYDRDVRDPHLHGKCIRGLSAGYLGTNLDTVSAERAPISAFWVS
jgi:hypothetical protein